MGSPLTGPMQENEVPLTMTAQGTSGIDSKQSGRAKASQIAQPHQLRCTIFSEICIQLRIRIRMNQYPSVRHHRSRSCRNVTGISFSLWSRGPRRPRQSVPSDCVHWIRLEHVRRIDDSTIRRSGWRRAKGAAGSERNKARAARDSELPSIQNSSVYPCVFSIPNRVAWMIGILNARHRIRAGLTGFGGPSSSSGVGGSESQSFWLLSIVVCGSKCSTVCYFCRFFPCLPLRNQWSRGSYRVFDPKYVINHEWLNIYERWERTSSRGIGRSLLRSSHRVSQSGNGLSLEIVCCQCLKTEW